MWCHHTHCQIIFHVPVGFRFSDRMQNVHRFQHQWLSKLLLSAVTMFVYLWNQFRDSNLAPGHLRLGDFGNLKYKQIFNLFWAVCRFNNYKLSHIDILKLKLGKNWRKFNKIFNINTLVFDDVYFWACGCNCVCVCCFWLKYWLRFLAFSECTLIKIFIIVAIEMNISN